MWLPKIALLRNDEILLFIYYIMYIQLQNPDCRRGIHMTRCRATGTSSGVLDRARVQDVYRYLRPRTCVNAKDSGRE